jgi:Zn-dependent protease with chaperone function
VAGPNTTSWVPWLAPTLTVLLALLVSLIGAEVIRGSAAGHLDGLRSAHWTAQTQVFSETNKLTALFRVYLITLTTTLVLFFQADLRPQSALRFGALVLLLVLLAGDPLAGRWVRRATAGQLAPLSWREMQRFGLLMFPARWLLIAFAAVAPRRYDALGWLWAAGLLGSLSLVSAGAAAWLARICGWLQPVSEAVRAEVAALARGAGGPVPKSYELKMARANALALPLLGWMVFTSAALEQLEPQAVSAIAAHELGHLREPLPIKLLRVAGGTSLFCLMGFVPAYPDSPLSGFSYGCGLFVVLAWGMRMLSRSLERRADRVARHHEADAGDYAAALERLYQLNWMAAGVASPSHPSLYDRLEQAGVCPRYARPPAPARSPRLLVFAFALIFALFLAFMLNPMLAMWFGAL